MAGAITTLGIGSGLDLQNILDQLKTAEKAPITAKETQKTELQEKINAYNGVNSKLFSMKSSALSLSLESDFLNTKTSVSDEDILTATANNGIESSSHSIEVVQKAVFSSWQTDGVPSKDTIIYEGPDTGIASKDESVTTESSTMAIKYGALESQQAIDIDLNPGMSLTQIVGVINSSEANKDEEGNLIVMASLGTIEDGDFYIRLASASPGDSADSQVSVEGADFAVADVTISIGKAGDEDPMYLSVAPGTTYEQIAADINAASDNPGVTASIVDTGTSENPFKLTLTANNTGEENRLVIQNLPMAEMTGADQASLNAIFKVNGVEYQRQTNSGITDVISGVTLNFKKAGETSLGVQRNLDPVKENIKSLVKGFNELIAEIKGSDGDSTSTEDEDDELTSPLADSFDMKSLLSKLSSLITTSINPDSQYINLVDLGVEINKDGTMSLDEDKLEQAVEADPDAVQTLFIGDADAGITGLGDIIDDGITEMVSSQGLVSTEIDSAQIRMENLDKSIEAATARLDKEYDTMTKQFILLDKTISSLNAQSTAMNTIIDSFTKTTEK
ncbi:MAG: flagellar filament capping protein FliD [Desulfobacter sp.]|nr:MAG: flagellar filament capping protein FliD [Desulfobacter sp.]